MNLGCFEIVLCEIGVMAGSDCFTSESKGSASGTSDFILQGKMTIYVQQRTAVKSCSNYEQLKTLLWSQEKAHLPPHIQTPPLKNQMLHQ